MQIEIGDEGKIERRVDAAGDRQRRNRTPNTRMKVKAPEKIGHASSMPMPTSTPVSAAVPRSASRRSANVPPSRRRSEAPAGTVRASPATAPSRPSKHVFVQRDRRAEIAAQHLPEPDDELLAGSAYRARKMRASRSMSAGVAPGGIIMAIGSPGTTRSSTKTIDRHAEQRDHVVQCG